MTLFVSSFVSIFTSLMSMLNESPFMEEEVIHKNVIPVLVEEDGCSENYNGKATEVSMGSPAKLYCVRP